MEDILLGSVDRSIFVFIPDSASTDGSGKTGLVAANLTVSYARMETDNDATVTDVTSSLSDLAALTTAHTDWGLKEVSNTLAPGLYRLDPADAVFASGAWTAVVYVMVTTSAAAAVPKAFNLVSYNALDSVRLGLTALPNAAAEASGGLPTLSAAQASNGTINANVHRWLTGTPNALQSGRVDSYIGAVAAGVIAAASFAANALDAVWSTATRVLTAGTNIVLAKGTGVTGFNDLSAAQVNSEADTAISDAALATAANLATVAGYLDTEIAAILADTNELQTDWANGGRLDLILDARASQTSVDDLPTNAELATSQAAADDATLAAIAALNNLSAAQVNAEVDTALADIHLDHLLATTYDPASKPGAADALLNELVESDGGVARYTANALEQAPTGGTAPTVSEIADEVQTRTIAAVTTVNGLAANTVTAAALAADAVTEIQSGLATTTHVQEVEDKVDAVDLVVDAILVDTAEIGAAGAGLTEAGGTGDHLTALATAAALATVDSEVGVIDGIVDNILLDTAEIGAAGAGLTAADDATLAAIAALNNLSSAQAQTAAAAALTAYDPPTHAELTTALAAADDAVLAAIAALNNLSSAQVTAAVPTAVQNADALLVRDFSVVTGEATRSALNALRFLRNKWGIAGGTLTVTEEDDTTTAWTAAVTQTAGDPVSAVDPT